ncbi:MAG: hypothetical protein RMJ35_00380 [Phycisphaerales bacterium]|nr:hypothetical protein [Phycisphaerales bacterium]
MDRRIAFPFLTLPPDAIKADPWQVSIDGGPEGDLQGHIDGWDYNSVLILHRKIRVDPPSALNALQLEPDDFIPGVVVRLGTGSSLLPRLVVASEICSIPPGWEPLDIRLDVNGAQLSTALFIHTDLVLLRQPESASALSPRDLGDRIWSDQAKVWLEGPEPRFPIEEAVLEDQFAPWKLVWVPGDWSRDFHGAVRLCLNRNRSDVIQKVTGEDPFTLQTVMADAIGQLVEGFLAEDDPVALAGECPEGSLGDQVSRWIHLLFPTGGIAAARQALATDRGGFRQKVWQLSFLEED